MLRLRVQGRHKDLYCCSLRLLSTRRISAQALLGQFKRIQIINDKEEIEAKVETKDTSNSTNFREFTSNLATDKATSPSRSAATSKILLQYRQLKNEHPSYMILMQVGDFFEVFDSDAEKASKILEIGLCNNRYGTQMTGIPTRSLETFLDRLVKANINVVIVEQLVKGNLIHRQVTRLVTKGTLTEDSLLESSSNNFICCIEPDSQGNNYSLAWIDISTGYFRTTLVEENALMATLQRINPTEIIVPDSMRTMNVLHKYIRSSGATFNNPSQQDEKVLDNVFGEKDADMIRSLFNTIELQAVTQLLQFVVQTQVGKRPFIEIPQRFAITETMKLDLSALRALEIIRNNTTASRDNSLLQVIDQTNTAVGSRLLAQRIISPLLNIAEINQRLDYVEFFITRPDLVKQLTKILRECRDMERSFQRLVLGRSVGGPKDMLLIKETLYAVKMLLDCLSLPDTPCIINSCIARMDPCDELVNVIEKAIVESPPTRPGDGRIIKIGFCQELDKLRAQTGSLEEQRNLLIESYRRATGKTSLKLSSRKTLGLLLEVNKTEGPIKDPKFILDSVIGDKYRYRTTELEALNAHSNDRDEKIIQEEICRYEEIRQLIVAAGKRIMRTSKAIAELDVAVASASLASKNGHVRPQFSEQGDFYIKGGRHPVVEEKHLEMGRSFTRNDCNLHSNQRFALVTGPNMGGKSTFLRQNAIIPILAQCGLYVPADQVILPLVDAIFTRIGASDDLARDKSTFMVEMSETAEILRNVTSHSLVIMDEIGRGTAALEGFALAKAICEYLYHKGCRTLFATHYTRLATLKDRLTNLQFLMTSAEMIEGDICFLHRVLPGVADKSHAIEVAKLAGIPQQVIESAQIHLKSQI